jgi:hypothetical protein
MKGTATEDWTNQISSPSNKNTDTIGTIHQSLFSQRKENSSFVVLETRPILLKKRMAYFINFLK